MPIESMPINQIELDKLDPLEELPELYYIQGEYPMIKTRNRVILYAQAIFEDNYDEEMSWTEPKTLEQAKRLINWFGEELYLIGKPVINGENTNARKTKT
jgi:hypothetical protein